MSQSSPIQDQEFANARHVLALLRSQVGTGQIDRDYAQRQIDKLSDLIGRAEESQRATKHSGRFEALYNVSRILGTSLELQTVLEQVMDAVIQITGAERGFLMLRNDDGELQVKVGRNIDPQKAIGEEFRYSRTIAYHVLDTGEAILTTNAVEDPRFSGQASIVAQALRSIMAAPLRARGNIIGVAYVENRVVAGLFSNEDLATLETFAAQASVTLDNVMLFSATDQELTRRVDELSELRRIDLKLNEKLDPDEVISYLLETACRMAHAQGGHLGFVQLDEGAQIVATQHYADEQSLPRESMRLDTRYPQIREVIEKQHSLAFEEDGATPRSYLALPVQRERRVMAVLLLWRSGHSLFSTEEREILERLTARAAVTMENARLYAAVQAADKAKSEFVGIVAHDLKAPMTSIRGYADLLLLQGHENLTERQKTFLQRISETVKRMEILVSDLADLSRIESGQFFMDERRVPIVSVLDAVRDTTMPEIQVREHEYIEEAKPDLPDLHVDYYRLVQVLTNLLSNAYKYTPDGGKITLKAWQEAERVFFSVMDTGIGMNEESLAALGTKFWRAEDEYTRSQPGTGLGFAITRRLTAQMGSEIEIRSQVGQGSQFTFSVPAFIDGKG